MSSLDADITEESSHVADRQIDSTSSPSKKMKSSSILSFFKKKGSSPSKSPSSKSTSSSSSSSSSSVKKPTATAAASSSSVGPLVSPSPTKKVKSTKKVEKEEESENSGSPLNTESASTGEQKKEAMKPKTESNDMEVESGSEPAPNKADAMEVEKVAEEEGGEGEDMVDDDDEVEEKKEFTPVPKDESEDECIEEENMEEEEEEEEGEEEEDVVVGKDLRADGKARVDNTMDVGNFNYDPIKDATWAKGKPVPYQHIAEVFEQIGATSKRLEKVAIVSDFFRSVIKLTPEDLLSCVYLCCNKIAPAYESMETGVGDGIIQKAICEATGCTLKVLRSSLQKIGDLGEVAQASRSTQKTMFPPPPLHVRGVYKQLRAIATMSGSKSQIRKKDTLKKMLVSCKGNQAKYIIRAFQGKNLRIGLAESSVLKGLARAVVLSPPLTDVMDARKDMSIKALRKKFEEASHMIDTVYTEVPSHDQVVPCILKYPVAELSDHCFLTPGVPVKAMLGRPTRGIGEALDRFKGFTFTFEYKYDGERAQIHLLPDGTIRIFSRNSEDHTGKYPDIIESLPTAIRDRSSVTSFIIDCEVVAYDTKREKILPFQTLSTRKRKAVAEEDVEVSVCLFGFDMICLNGQSYMRKPFGFRRSQLMETFLPVKGMFQYAIHCDTSEEKEIQEFLDESIKNSTEGLMVKALDGPDSLYTPNVRKWLKIKKDYMDGMTDTIDLVPIGGFYGKGKRTGVYGAFLLACYDPDEEEYQCITKIGTGLKDEDLANFAEFFKGDKILKEKPNYYRVSEKVAPDVYFEPAQVWEVQAADLSISPVHLAAVGKVNEAKGIALRFPRLLRVRDDKNPEDATSSDQVVDMYMNQQVVQDNL